MRYLDEERVSELERRETSERRSKRKKRRGSKGIWTLPFLAFCGVASLILAYLCQSAQLVRVQYEVLSQRQEVKSLAAERDDLELSVQELTSLERVEHVAVNKLGMVDPEERKVIEVVWSHAPEPGAEVASTNR